MGTREYTLVPNLVIEITLLNIYATSCEISEIWYKLPHHLPRLNFICKQIMPSFEIADIKV